MALLLHQRNVLSLHASVVDIGGAAVAFLGAKGHGKSTMAAALYRRGHWLMSDDIAALDWSDNGTVAVLPGAVQFKLWPDSVANALGADPTSYERLILGGEKRACLVSERLGSEAVPLRAIYILSYGDTPNITSIEGQERISVLLAHSYAARFGSHLLSGDQASSHFLHCARLAHGCPVYRLIRPQALDQLDIVAALVEQHSLETRSNLISAEMG
jgi:hypothetical protein